ncbi:MAG: hypothetical protein IPP83_07390 [Flavobacteriales bacterium]|nr:hypothetical protein [Flavobacteriales bacterium]
MKTIPWKKLLPVVVAIAVFYALSLTYFSPVLEGKKLVQGDLKNWQGMAQEILEHRTAFDEDPLWTGSMFSGMPAYQIMVLWPKNLLRFADDVFHGFLPRPACFLFLYLLGMYILFLCLRVDPWLSLVGALAFGFSSYFFAILEAGHNSKANAIGYMPMVLGAVYMLYRGRVLFGGAMLALFMGLEIAMNHVQITYYLGFVLVLFLLAEAVRAMREKQVVDFAKRSGIGAVAVILAVACNAGMLWTTAEYGSYTTRGKSELTIKVDGSSAGDVQTSGLDRDYVTQWSYGKQESFSLLIPNAKGGASASIIQKQEDFNQFNDPTFRKAIMDEYQSGGYVNSYWGDQSFTSGPVYIGAVVVLLLLLMLGSVEGAGRWWILGSIPFLLIMLAINNASMENVDGVAYVVGMRSATLMGMLLFAYLVAGLWFVRDALVFALFSSLLITLMLSWGHHFMPFTDLFLDHVPGYSKFRAVTIILVIVELAAPVLAVLYLDRLSREGVWDKAKRMRFLILSGSLLVVLLLFALIPSNLMEFISDAERAKYNAQIEGGAPEAAVVDFVSNLKEYRIGVFTGDVWRSFLFVALGAALVYLFGRRTVGRGVLVAGLSILVLADQWSIDKRYVNNEKDKGRYRSWEDEKASLLPFKPNGSDMAILQNEWTPQAEAYQKGVIEKMKEQRSNLRGADRLVAKDEEMVARFGSLRRTTDYRVLNLGNPFNDSRVSYFHKSIGGYHGAKLERYQELIEFHLGPAIMRIGGLLRSGTSLPAMDSLLASEGVLNMLNTRYLVYDPERPPIMNTNAYGSAWFVDELRYVKDANEEITALGTIDPARTALVDERYHAALGDGAIAPDPTASVTLDSYNTNELKYAVRSNGGGLVVFSEIWYGPDWKASIDGTPVEHVRADYVLRALRVPAGEHTVVFKVEGGAYSKSQPIMLAGSILVLLIALGAIGMEVRRKLGGSSEAGV